MGECNPVATPVDPGTHLTKLTEEEEAVDQQQYQSVIGSLMYLSVCTRPDIAYAVGTLSRYSSKPGKSHWTAVKKVLRYLKGRTHHGIVFRGGESGNIVGYSDADWAGDREDRKSTSGYLQADLFLGEVRSKTLLLCLRQGRSMLPCPVPLKKPSGRGG